MTDGIRLGCAECGCEWPEQFLNGEKVVEDTECPGCGSTNHVLTLHVEERLPTPHDSVAWDARPPGAGKKKRFWWGKIGQLGWHHDDGLWTRVTRFFNKQNDTYVEEIVDHQTDEVRRSVNEPLSKHRNTKRR